MSTDTERAAEDGIHSPHNACMFRDHCRAQARAAIAQQAEPAQHVKIPTNVEEAEAMLRVSTLWMQQHAPEMLRALLRAPLPVQADAQPVAPEPPGLPRAMQWGALYTAACGLTAQLGRDGSIQADAAAVDALMNALHDLDNGEWMPGLMPAPWPAAPTARQPLTDEQLREAFRTSADNLTLRAHWQGLKAFARAIERAHGITAQRTQEGEKP